MYVYSMGPYLLHYDRGFLSDINVVYFSEIINTIVLSQWKLSIVYQMYLWFLGMFSY